MAAIIEARKMTKAYRGAPAIRDVDFDVNKGEIHALLGENGAGKTTLMRIVDGILRPDAGTIAVAGRPVRFSSPRDAIAAGIGMVHQHFTNVPAMTVGG